MHLFSLLKAVAVNLIAISILSGCATTNQELRDAFASKGFETEERTQGVIVFFPGLFFESDKYVLVPDAALKVRDIASLLNDSGVEKRMISLEGHTDSNGTDEYNQNLSEQRAKTVYQELLTNKVKAERLKTAGYGETRPIAENNKPDGSPNAEGQAKNRRVEIVVLNPEKN
ncbi:MAG: OmpA family protein [Methyloglobulus sp.]|nr:OmpA family protein [Methyloglobulus sp.]